MKFLILYIQHFLSSVWGKAMLPKGYNMACVDIGGHKRLFNLITHSELKENKANLRDLKAATGLVILLKLDSNHRFLAGVTLKFDGPRKIIQHVFYTTSSFVYHFISISEIKLELQSRPWKTIGHLFKATSSFVHHFVAIGDLKLEIQSGNTQFGSKSTIFRAVWPCNLTYDLEKQ